MTLAARCVSLLAGILLCGASLARGEEKSFFGDSLGVGYGTEGFAVEASFGSMLVDQGEYSAAGLAFGCLKLCDARYAEIEASFGWFESIIPLGMTSGFGPRLEGDRIGAQTTLSLLLGPFVPLVRYHDDGFEVGLLLKWPVFAFLFD